jgi:hypothetical protein
MTARHSKKSKSVHGHAKSHRRGKGSARDAILAHARKVATRVMGSRPVPVPAMGMPSMDEVAALLKRGAPIAPTMGATSGSRGSALSSDRMRLGWLVAFVMAVTMAIAICGGREERKEAPALDSTLDAFADAGAAADEIVSVAQG